MVKIDYSRDSLLTDFGKETLKDRYLMPGEASPQDAFARAAVAFSDDEDHAQRMYDYASKLWFMFSTPILSNGGTKRGLGISCYLSAIGDSRREIAEHWTENMFLASMGGGIGSYAGQLRGNGTGTSSGSQSGGSIPFLKVVDSEILAVSQGKTRRGSFAFYQDINHPDIEESITIRKPTGGDPNRKCLNIHHGMNITHEFMEAVKYGKPWDLIDPHSKEIKKTINARRLWELLLETRMQTGEPYLHFIDTTNEALPETQKQLGLKVVNSNLCSEVTLVANEDRTAVCCLSSVNLETYEEWKDDPKFIDDLVRFLDNVLTSFIKEAPPELKKAVYSAIQERSIGIGAMGFHSFLQKNMIPFAGPLAIGLNDKIFETIKNRAILATENLAVERGSPPDALWRKIRNLHLLAIAPNASSSIICGETSPSIEPLRANAFTQKTLSGSFLVKNKFLEKLLKEKGRNTQDIWTSIIVNKGSVQHLDFLDDWEKDVFKTAGEIDQHWIIELAARRQKYICQSQSVNLFFSPDVDVKYIHDVHFSAWEKGLKSLYYLRSESVRKPRVSEKIERVVRQDAEDCFSCQG